MRMRVLALFVIIAALACSRVATRGTKLDAPRGSITDSVVLERTRCFGLCPAYRVRVDRRGEVIFVSHNAGEERLTALDSVAAWVVDSLTLDATLMDFFALPDSIVPGSPLCPLVATDHPTITIGVFGRSSKQVVYYTGCHWRDNLGSASRLGALGQLAAHIDTLTRTNRWIRAARSR